MNKQIFLTISNLHIRNIIQFAVLFIKFSFFPTKNTSQLIFPLFFPTLILKTKKTQQIIIIMGANESFPSTMTLYGIKQLDQNQWQPCPSTLKRTTSTAQLNKISTECKPLATYSSLKHSFLIDEYLVQLNDKSNKESYFEIFQWRNSNKFVVHAKYIKGFNPSFICEPLEKNYLYVEHIPLRLSQITDIPFPDSLYLIYACLNGFQYLYQKFQNLEVREELVCLDREGKIKVWMNANLSAITPSINNVYVSIRKSEISIVNDILKMTNANIDHEMQPKNFQEYLLQQKMSNLTFQSAIKALQHFAYLLNANIPNYLQSAYDLFNPFLNSHNTSVNIARIIKEQTIETKMIESIPIYSERMTNRIPDCNIESKVIKYEQDYHIPEKEYWRSVYNNNQTHHIVNFVKDNRHNEEKIKQNSCSPIFKQYTPIYVGIDQQKPHTIDQIQGQSNQQQWRYFNEDKWTEIDPQILQDLKKMKKQTFS